MICHFQPDNIWRASQLAEQDPSTTASLAAGFLAQYTEDNEKRVLRSIDFETASPETQEGLRKVMEKEWEKFLHFGAVVVIEGAEKDALLQQGHVMILSSSRSMRLTISRSGRADWCHAETLSKPKVFALILRPEIAICV